MGELPEVWRNQIKVYVLEKLPRNWQRTATGVHKDDGSYAMIYIKEQKHAWVQQINYTGGGVEEHNKIYDKPLPLCAMRSWNSRNTGIEEARIAWKQFVKEGYNRLSLARLNNPCHLNTLIDEDIEAIT